MSSDEDERAPLTCDSLLQRGKAGEADFEDTGGVVLNINGNPVEKEDDDEGYSNYKLPNRFRTGRYGGYCTLGSEGSTPRISMHDSWDDAKYNNNATTNTYHDQENDCNVICDNGDDEYEEDDEEDDNGDFISFWGVNDDDATSSCNSCSNNENTAKQNQPQHLLLNDDDHNQAVNSDTSEDDGRVETTMRPIPLLYRKYKGGNVCQGNFDDNPNNNSLGRWFQRELGWASLQNEVNGNGNRDRGRPLLWGLGRRRIRQQMPFDDFDNSEDEGLEEEDEDDTADNDANSLLASSTSDENNYFMGNGDHSYINQERAPSPFGVNNWSSTRNEDFSRGRRNVVGLMSLPIVRPFLRGSRRGFSDVHASSNALNEDDSDSGIDDANNNLTSKRDRAAVIQSISRGIAGTTDASLLLDTGEGNNNGNNTKQSTSTSSSQPPPNNLLGRIFLTRFIQAPNGGSIRAPNNNKNNSMIIQLHNLLRKEDWNLATTLLESNPDLASTWHKVDRLYGGRYDGEALPIHAACALHPPPSFIEMLGSLYPGGLIEKDKAFGRVPLHVACRSLAESSVIRVLCEMDPKCVVERDSLKRVPLHYLIKNYCTFGDDNDEDDNSTDDNKIVTGESENRDADNSFDGIVALKLLIENNPNCVHCADHRGWLPLHVACSCSSRKGMMRVMKLLLKSWPESIHEKTEKDSDVFACVDMAGKHHPTKNKVISLLQEAKFLLDKQQTEAINQSGDSSEGSDNDAIENSNSNYDEEDDYDSLPEPSQRDLSPLDEHNESPPTNHEEHPEEPHNNSNQTATPEMEGLINC